MENRFFFVIEMAVQMGYELLAGYSRGLGSIVK